MLKTEITSSLFETWKDQMRELFKPDPKSMDLIAIYLRCMEDLKYKDKIEQYNKALLNFYENDLADRGELFCEHCGKAMEVYFTVQCFHCESCKPKIEKYEGNYICATKWLENNESEFDDNYVWSYLYNRELIKNDSYMVLPDDNQSDIRYNKNIALFKKHFPIEDIKWFVSW